MNNNMASLRLILSNYLYFRSILPPDALPHLTSAERKMYERVWDESDYVIPPAENSAFFVMTNVVITPNQTIGTCPEDHTEIKGVVCGSSEGDHVNITEGVCLESDVKILHKGHGEETGNCILSDRDESAYVCEISSWCPGMIQYYFFEISFLTFIFRSIRYFISLTQIVSA